MPAPAARPAGAPCWADLWTSDVEGSRAFYGELLGWEALPANPEFGGYFMFTLHGAPVAGCMGDMGDMRANDTWRIYLTTPDMGGTVARVAAEGGEVTVPGMPVADLGVQAIFVDPTGAPVGAWQPGTFEGFGLMDEPGAPSWFELHTRDHDRAVAFYRNAFGWDVEPAPASGVPYSVSKSPSGGAWLAGVMDAGAFLPQGATPSWVVYWAVDDHEGAVAAVERLGGTRLGDTNDSPWGKTTAVTDPQGARFSLHSPRRA